MEERRVEIMQNLAPFFRTSEKIAEKMLKLAKPKEGEILYDIGAGDGAIVILAAKKFRLKAVAIEADKTLCEILSRNIKNVNLENQVEIINDDVFNVSLENADIVTIFLTAEGNELIKSKLEKELKPGSRIISHDFEIPGWKPKEVKRIGDCFIYVYEL